MPKRVLDVARDSGGESDKEVEPPSSSDDDDDDDGDDVSEDSFADFSRSSKENKVVVNVEFEFFDPKETDFSGVKALLKSYTDSTVIDVNSMVDAVLAQTRVGTVLKMQDDETVLGLSTCLNLHKHRDAAWMKQLRGFLEGKAKGSSEAGNLRALWEGGGGKRVGWLLSERIRNIPWELAPHLFQGLLDEIAWATEDEPTEELRQSFRFDSFVLLTRVYKDQLAAGKSQPGSSKRQKKKKKGQTKSSPDSLIYVRPEDEAFHQLSSWSLTFPVDAESLAPHQTKGVQELRLLMVLEATKVEAFKAKLKTVVAVGAR